MLKSFVGRCVCVCVVWETRWDDNATTVANPSTSPPSPPKAILAQGNFGSRTFRLNAIVDQCQFGSRPPDGGAGGGDGDGGADGDRDE